MSNLFDFSQLPDSLGGGQGPIEIHAISTVSDPTEYSNTCRLESSNDVARR